MDNDGEEGNKCLLNFTYNLLLSTYLQMIVFIILIIIIIITLYYIIE